MSNFSFVEKFKLEVHWSKVEYLSDGTIKLCDTYLSGPAISELLKLNPADHIMLDFISQYISLLSSYYIVKLSWDGVSYTDTKILLDNVLMTNSNIEKLPAIKASDYIVIDTSSHEDEKHNFNINYTSYLIRSDGVKYNFKD